MNRDFAARCSFDLVDKEHKKKVLIIENSNLKLIGNKIRLHLHFKINMVLKTVILNYTTYNHWANETFTGWLKSLDASLLYKETKSSFPSIDLTLQHMKNAQNFWHAVIGNTNINSLDQELRTGSVDWVIAELLKGSQNFVDMVISLNDDDLLAKASSPAITGTRYEFILHAINHNSYHRGQITTITRSLGITENIPNTDYENYLWLRTNESTL
jgi:uncharacterized damage-inducible protein DinB